MKHDERAWFIVGLGLSNGALQSGLIAKTSLTAARVVPPWAVEPIVDNPPAVGR